VNITEKGGGSILPSVRIREYTPADVDALRRLHAAQSFGYPFPDLESPLFIAKLVLEEDSRTGFSLSGSEPWEGSKKCDRLKPVLLDAASGSTDFSLWGAAGRTTGHATSVENPQTEVCATKSARTNSVDVQGREEADRDSLFAGSASVQRGRITMAVLLRLTAETYLLHDPQDGTPRQRWQHLLALHEAARCAALACGLDDVQAFLPPRIARAFGRRLARLGWTHDPWPCFSRQLP
jgi:hypothetical protein